VKHLVGETFSRWNILLVKHLVGEKRLLSMSYQTLIRIFNVVQSEKLCYVKKWDNGA
jgi:hypothetical protein